MVLRVMHEVVMLRKAIEGSRRTRCVEERVIEGVSGEHGVLGVDDSVVEGDGSGNAVGKPASPAEDSSVQVGTCEVGYDGVDRLAGETPNRPPLQLQVHMYKRAAQQLRGWQQSRR